LGRTSIVVVDVDRVPVSCDVQPGVTKTHATTINVHSEAILVVMVISPIC